ATSPNHTYLAAALQQEGLDVVLQDQNASYTVFAPTNAAFDNLASALGTNISGLLALPNLSDILLYHVLNVEVASSAVTNGAIVNPLSTTNTLKLTKTSTGNVFVNQAQVSTADLTADNGTVHVLEGVVLPAETVADVAIDNGFTTLVTAVVQEELLPALTDPLASYTVFAPTNTAFDNLATALGTNINGLLALPNLTDVLLYHVLNVEVASSAVTNGAIVSPLSATNTLKLTKTSTGNVFVNQAQVSMADVTADNGTVHVLDAVVLPVETVADVAIDNGFTTLVTAVVQEELLPALTDPLASYTVFAPTNTAFDNLAAALGTNINGLLALPNLSDVLLYHVLNVEVASSAVTNGAIVNPLSTTNTLKLTKTSMGNVFVNQAQVSLADVTADNGTVHVLDAVVLPVETVADVAIDNGFTTLVTAVIQEELLPALTDPLASYTVFAPTNTAFDNLAAALGTNINGLLALPNLSDVLLYHVLNVEVASSAVTNGAIVNPLSTTNTLKLTKTSMGNVFVNQAQVSLADVTADNGTVHVLDAVVLPVETVADVAIDNGFTTLVTAVIQEELLPALTDPLASYTVFAPTNTAFDNLAAALGTNINGLLALPNLSDVLLYHVLGTEVLSSALTNGTVTTLNGQTITVDLTSGVKINNANVTTPDVLSDNGVVHVIDAVLVPASVSVDEAYFMNPLIFSPNPSTDYIQVKNFTEGSFEVIDILGKTVLNGLMQNQQIDVTSLPAGSYLIRVAGESSAAQSRFVKL
ncbi:MAG: fasciclin domain-containing protein, partial [Bacteroidia bacterium]|nr:fasciclin domain-containing protein [Bacteroidia bacterium]